MTLFLHTTPEPPWRSWNAWHPVFTHDRGMVWAWPWKRQALYRRLSYYTAGFADESPVYEYKTHAEVE